MRACAVFHPPTIAAVKAFYPHYTGGEIDANVKKWNVTLLDVRQRLLQPAH